MAPTPAPEVRTCISRGIDIVPVGIVEINRLAHGDQYHRGAFRIGQMHDIPAVVRVAWPHGDWAMNAQREGAL